MKKTYFLLLIVIIAHFSCRPNNIEDQNVYYENGKIHKEFLKEHGKVYKVVTYLKTGEKEYEVDVRDNKRNGREVLFNKSGTIKSMRYFVDDKAHGFCILFKDNGSVNAILEYRGDSLISNLRVDDLRTD